MFTSTNELRGVGKYTNAVFFCFRKYLTLVIGCIYATVLVTLGLIIYIGSPMVEPNIALVSTNYMK